jgi:hypothetical protein
MHQRQENGSLGLSLGNLARSVGKLVDLEAAIARRELTEKASTAGEDVAYIAIGGAVGYAGFLVLLAGAVDVLSARLPRWQAALLVGTAVSGAGGLLVRRGITALKREDLVPHRTVETVRTSAETMLDHLR